MICFGRLIVKLRSLNVNNTVDSKISAFTDALELFRFKSKNLEEKNI